SFDMRVNLFFFSSRRRHTRFSRDWSSDVCSSDLLRVGRFPPPNHALSALLLWPMRTNLLIRGPRMSTALAHQVSQSPTTSESDRSEEHTSELQSRETIVCRLPLEKKKIKGKGQED